MRPLLILLLLTGCSDPPPALTPTPWGVLHQAFEADFFDATRRARAFTPDAARRLALPGLLDEARYRFLSVADLRRLAPDRLAAAIDYEVDGWPLSLSLELQRSPEGWRIDQLQSPGVQRAWLGLLGVDGLPSAPSAAPWRGGLSGRDEAGRPTAGVLVVALAGTAYVDGVAIDLPGERSTAIRRALDARARLAREAHATYRPQVVVAAGRETPAGELLALLKGGFDAGAEAAALLVRGTGGDPGLLPIARTTAAPPGPPPPVLRVTALTESHRLEVAERSREVPLERGVVAPPALARAIDAIDPGPEPLAGALLVVPADSVARELVRLVHAVRAARPKIPIALRVEQ